MFRFYSLRYLLAVLLLPLGVCGRDNNNTPLTPLKRGSADAVGAVGSMVDKDKAQLSQGQLCFIENKGQVTDQYGNARNDIQYKLSTPGMSVFVGDGAIHYQWTPRPSTPRPPKGGGGAQEYEAGLFPLSFSQENTAPPLGGRGYRMDVILLGANKHAKVLAEEAQAYYEHYYTGDLQLHSEGITAHTWRRITYKEVYPHIDWVLYIKDGHMEYDFVVRPGGRVQDIRLQYNGADKLTQNVDGSISSSTPMGSISEQKPYSYEQETNTTVASSFRLKGHIISFDIAAHEPANTLVIDPALIWSTYYGYNTDGPDGTVSFYPGGLLYNGAPLYNGSPQCKPVCDANSNVFISGYTSSASNIATTGAYLTTLPTQIPSSFLSEFDPSGQLLWGTYFGAVSSGALAYDPAGYLYITGDIFNNVHNISTPGAYQDTINGGGDAFLAKFSTGGALVWSTYFGGDSLDAGDALSCDAAGNVYITGGTTSINGIATMGAYQTTNYISDSFDAFLAKFSSSGALQWSTYFGGSGDDAGYGLACDAAGNVYMTGGTTSSSHIAVNGLHNSPGGAYDGFLAKFDGFGNIQWSTYYGGANDDYAIAVTCDRYSNAYIVGVTSSTTGIASGGAYLANTAGGGDAFLAKFDGSGNQLWGTYYGGGGLDAAFAVACDTNGNAFISGQTLSTTGIATAKATQPALGGGRDAFLAKFTTGGNLTWGSYLGGNYLDRGFGITCSRAGGIYVAGYTNSSNNIATPGAYQATGGHPMYSISPFLALYSDDSLFINQPFKDTLHCAGDSFRAAYTTNLPFANGNIFTAQLSDANGSFAHPVNIGSLATTTSDSILCILPANTATGTHYRIRVMASNPLDSSLADSSNIHIKGLPQLSIAGNSPVCTGDSIRFTTTVSGTYTYQWTGPNSFSVTTQSPYRTNAVFADSGNYMVTIGLNGCSVKDTVHIAVWQTPATPVATNNGPICAGDNLELQAASSTNGVSYSWAGPVYSSTAQNPTLFNAATTASGAYTVTATLNGCSSSASTTAVVNATNAAPVVSISVSPSDTICGNTPVTFTAVVSNGGSNPVYQWRRNGAAISGATADTYTEAGQLNSGDKITCHVTGNAICQAVDTGNSNTIKVYLITYPMPGISISVYPPVFVLGDTTTFTAIVTNGNPVNLTFQWLKNGVAIPGANSSTYSSTTFAAGDQVALFVASSKPCTVPDTLLTNTISLAIGQVNNLMGIKIYPNPNKGTFTIETSPGPSKGGEVLVYNTLGQVVYKGLLAASKQTISLDVPPGVYMLELTDDSGGRTQQRLVITK